MHKGACEVRELDTVNRKVPQLHTAIVDIGFIGDLFRHSAAGLTKTILGLCRILTEGLVNPVGLSGGGVLGIWKSCDPL